MVGEWLIGVLGVTGLGLIALPLYSSIKKKRETADRLAEAESAVVIQDGAAAHLLTQAEESMPDHDRARDLAADAERLAERERSVKEDAADARDRYGDGDDEVQELIATAEEFLHGSEREYGADATPGLNLDKAEFVLDLVRCLDNMDEEVDSDGSGDTKHVAERMLAAFEETPVDVFSGPTADVITVVTSRIIDRSEAIASRYLEQGVEKFERESYNLARSKLTMAQTYAQLGATAAEYVGAPRDELNSLRVAIDGYLVLSNVARGDTELDVETALTLAAFAETHPSVVAKFTGDLVDSLTEPATRGPTIAALAEVARENPGAVEDHITEIGAATNSDDESLVLDVCRTLQRVGTKEAIDRLRDVRLEVDDYEVRAEIEEMIREAREHQEAETVHVADIEGSIPQPGSATVTPGANDDVNDALPAHEVLDSIGSGGNADVNKIRLEESGGVAALKIPRWQGTLSNAVVEEFRDEAATWARIDDNDHIVDVLGSGARPHPWILLEYMPDGSLRDRIDQNHISSATVIEILLEVCDAIRHAHRHGIVHADLKPENVLFSGDTAKVGDWGLAKVLLEHSTSIEGMTPNYAAPEQVDPDQYDGVDDLTDIYQLGVITYEALTGNVPYKRSNPAGTVSAILSENPTPPSDVDGRLPGEVDDVVLTAMAKEKADRYESVLYFRDALRELDF